MIIVLGWLDELYLLPNLKTEVGTTKGGLCCVVLHSRRNISDGRLIGAECRLMRVMAPSDNAPCRRTVRQLPPCATRLILKLPSTPDRPHICIMS